MRLPRLRPRRLRLSVHAGAMEHAAAGASSSPSCRRLVLVVPLAAVLPTLYEPRRHLGHLPLLLRVGVLHNRVVQLHRHLVVRRDLLAEGAGAGHGRVRHVRDGAGDRVAVLLDVVYEGGVVARAPVAVFTYPTLSKSK